MSQDLEPYMPIIIFGGLLLLTFLVYRLQVFLIGFQIVRMQRNYSKRVHNMIRTYNSWDAPTPDEINLFLVYFKCPDCTEHPTLWEGPSGGLCINFKCPCCGSEFNIMMGGYIGGIRQNASDVGGGFSGKEYQRISNSSLHKEESKRPEVLKYMKEAINNKPKP